MTHEDDDYIDPDVNDEWALRRQPFERQLLGIPAFVLALIGKYWVGTPTWWWIAMAFAGPAAVVYLVLLGRDRRRMREIKQRREDKALMQRLSEESK